MRLMILLISLATVNSFAKEWDEFPVPADPGDGYQWQLHPLSDDFNYEAPAKGKSEAFYARWSEGFINQWSGPSLTEWHPSQSYVRNGHLVLTAKRKRLSNKILMGSITSKESLTYPLYMEVRAKLMNQVLASDFWLLSKDSTEEIDVLEAYGGDRAENKWFAERLHLSHHVFIREPFQDYQPKTDDTWYYNGTVWREDFHRIGVYWRDPWHLEYYVNGKLTRVSSGKDVIDPHGYTKGTGLSKPMQAIINLEDQDWRMTQGLTPTDEELNNTARQPYMVDWVRFYKPVATK
ncbi:MAG: family 16 glycosylhydrolase [Aliiglaciecola sp.]